MKVVLAAIGGIFIGLAVGFFITNSGESGKMKRRSSRSRNPTPSGLSAFLLIVGIALIIVGVRTNPPKDDDPFLEDKTGAYKSRGSNSPVNAATPISAKSYSENRPAPVVDDKKQSAFDNRKESAGNAEAATPKQRNIAFKTFVDSYISMLNKYGDTLKLTINDNDFMNSLDNILAVTDKYDLKLDGFQKINDDDNARFLAAHTKEYGSMEQQIMILKKGSQSLRAVATFFKGNLRVGVSNKDYNSCRRDVNDWVDNMSGMLNKINQQLNIEQHAFDTAK